MQGTGWCVQRLIGTVRPFTLGLHEQDIIVIDAAADVGVKFQIHSLLSTSLDRLANASV
jgi:hypothetical protein